MAWVKLDDHFPEHPKVAELGDEAPLCGWLYVCGLAWCNRHLTDGRIPKAMVPRLATFRGLQVSEMSIYTEELARKLVDAGLWEDAGDAYQVHDYLEYQPSKKASGKLSQARSKVGKQGARARWQADSKHDGKRHGKPVANTMANGMAKTCPDPDPDPEEQEHARRSADADAALPAPDAAPPGPPFDAFKAAWPPGRWEAAKQTREQWARLKPDERTQAVEAVAWRTEHDRRWQGPVEDGRWAIPIPWRWLRDRRFEDARQVVPTPTLMRSAGQQAASAYRAQAERLRDKAWGRCQHEERCESREACIALIARELAARAEEVA
jgi:hypothetical protein